MKKFTRKCLLSSVVVSVLGLANVANAQKPLVFTSWGGTTQKAQEKSWARPFSKKSGIKVLQDGPTDYGKIKAMVDSGKVSWDVVDVEHNFAVRAGKDGLLEPLDFSIIDKKNLDPRFVTKYAVGSFYYSFVLGYNKDVFKKQPKTWKDLFDLKKFPGKRTFYKWSAPGVLEIALLADGVKPKDLYPLDLDRAFKKLDTIKKHIIWWGGGAQSQQLLASTEAPIGMFWNGRLFALKQSGVNVGISWRQNLPAADVLVVPKGTKNKKAAMEFIAYASSAKGQADFATKSGYAPTNKKSEKLMDKKIVKDLPSKHTRSQVRLDMDYWAKNMNKIGSRWYAWQTK